MCDKCKPTADTHGWKRVETKCCKTLVCENCTGERVCGPCKKVGCYLCVQFDCDECNNTPPHRTTPLCDDCVVQCANCHRPNCCRAHGMRSFRGEKTPVCKGCHTMLVNEEKREKRTHAKRKRDEFMRKFAEEHPEAAADLDQESDSDDD